MTLPKRRYISTTRQGVTPYKTVVTTVWNLTKRLSALRLPHQNGAFSSRLVYVRFCRLQPTLNKWGRLGIIGHPFFVIYKKYVPTLEWFLYFFYPNFITWVYSWPKAIVDYLEGVFIKIILFIPKFEIPKAVLLQTWVSENIPHFTAFESSKITFIFPAATEFLREIKTDYCIYVNGKWSSRTHRGKSATYLIAEYHCGRLQSTPLGKPCTDASA